MSVLVRIGTERNKRLLAGLIVIILIPVALTVSSNDKVADFAIQTMIFLVMLALLRYAILLFLGTYVIKSNDQTVTAINRTYWQSLRVEFASDLEVDLHPKLLTIRYESVLANEDPKFHTEAQWIWMVGSKVLLSSFTADLEVVKTITKTLKKETTVKPGTLLMAESLAPEERQFGMFSFNYLFLPFIPLFAVFLGRSGQLYRGNLEDAIANSTAGILTIAVQFYLALFGIFALALGVHLKWKMELSSVDFEVSYRITRNLINLISYFLFSMSFIINAVTFQALDLGLQNYFGGVTLLSEVSHFLAHFFAFATFTLIPVLIVAFFAEIWWSGVLKQRRVKMFEQFDLFDMGELNLE